MTQSGFAGASIAVRSMPHLSATIAASTWPARVRQRTFIRTIVWCLAGSTAMLVMPQHARADLLYVSSGTTILRYDLAVLSGTVIQSTGTVFARSSVPAYGLATDLQGNVYAAMLAADRVFRYASSGTLTANWFLGTNSDPVDPAFDSGGNLLVSCDGLGRILRLDAAGVITGTISGVDPRGMAIDSSGNLFVASYAANSVVKFNSLGVSQGAFAAVSAPTGVAVDSSDNVYASGWNIDSVKKYSPSGSLVATIGSGQMFDPYGIAIDSAGNLIVAAYGSDKVLIYNPQGTQVASWSVVNPIGVAVFNPVPEPSAAWLAGSGILAAMVVASRIIRAGETRGAPRCSPRAASWGS